MLDRDRLTEVFYEQQLMHPLSTGQIALWHALVHIAAKVPEQEWITIAAITLGQLTGLSQPGLQKARNILKQRGLIDFRTKKGCSSEYSILESNLVSIPVSNSVGNAVGITGDARTRALSNHTITNNIPTLPPPQTPPPDGGFVRYIEDNIRGMTAGNWEALRSYMEDGLTQELICHAVDEAAAQGKQSWAYVRTILDRWMIAGVATVDQAKDLDAERKQAISQTGKRKRTVVQAPEGWRT